MPVLRWLGKLKDEHGEDRGRRNSLRKQIEIRKEKGNFSIHLFFDRSKNNSCGPKNNKTKLEETP